MASLSFNVIKLGKLLAVHAVFSALAVIIVLAGIVVLTVPYVLTEIPVVALLEVLAADLDKNLLHGVQLFVKDFPPSLSIFSPNFYL